MWYSKLRTWLAAVTAAAALALGGPALAGTVDGLYEVEVAVDSRSDADRAAGFRRALSQVLVKVTGDRLAPAHAADSPAFDDPARLVQRYRFSREATDDGDDRLLLRVRFDRDAVRTMLRDAGLPLWGDERPETLIWLAVQDGSDRYLVGGDDGPELRGALQRTAHARGLPVVMPLLDLEDQSRVDFTDLWGGFMDAVLQASQRYEARSVLVGRIYRDGDTWDGDWWHYQDGNEARWAARGDEAEAVVAEGLHGVADHLALRYTRPTGADGVSRVSLEIRDVTALQDYARTQRYLDSLSVVTNVQLAQIGNDRVVYELQVEGDRHQLQEVIGLGRTIRPVETRPADDDEPDAGDTVARPELPGALQYRLLP